MILKWLSFLLVWQKSRPWTFRQTTNKYHTGDSVIHYLIGSVPLRYLWVSVHKTWGELLHIFMPCSAWASSLVFAVVPEFQNNSKKGSASPYQLLKCDQHISNCYIYRVLFITQERTFMKGIQTPSLFVASPLIFSLRIFCHTISTLIELIHLE